MIDVSSGTQDKDNLRVLRECLYTTSTEFIVLGVYVQKY